MDPEQLDEKQHSRTSLHHLSCILYSLHINICLDYRVASSNKVARGQVVIRTVEITSFVCLGLLQQEKLRRLKTVCGSLCGVVLVMVIEH